MKATGAADAIVEFFNRRAVDYDQEYAAETTAGFALRVRRQKVLALFDRPGGDVLDVGCGPGVMAGEMAARGCRFWGVDPSASMLAIAESRHAGSKGIHFVKGDAGHLDFPDGSFDAVLCTGVIDSVPDAGAAVAEMLRVLKPGGTLVFTVTNLLGPYAWWKNYVFYPLIEMWHRLLPGRRTAGHTAQRRRSGGLRTLFTRHGAQRLVQPAGEVVSIVPYSFNLFISPLDEIFPRTALRVMERMERRGHPEWLAAGWILQARKHGASTSDRRR